MLTATITLTGHTWDDLDFGLAVVKEKLQEQHLTGYDANETGSYSFTVNGEEEIIPTIDFEYDINYFGGNYDQAGGTVPIPVSLIEEVGEEAAFEQFTGFSRHHIIDWDAEESEASGNGVTQNELNVIQQEKRAFMREHAPTCWACRKVAYQEKE